jgi:hypothetical protein
MQADFETVIWNQIMILVSVFNVATFLLFHSSKYLSGIYTFVCAFRSVFPRVDAERVVLYDNFLSSIFLGRTLATIAEVSFAIQVSSYNPVIVSQIILAQFFCWISVIKKDPFYHIIEESLWASAALSFLWEGQTVLSSFFILCYISYMILVDIPMYMGKYKAFNVKPLGFFAGLGDCVSSRTLVGDWRFWKREAMWMTPYFTLGVWATQWIY